MTSSLTQNLSGEHCRQLAILASLLWDQSAYILSREKGLTGLRCGTPWFSSMNREDPTLERSMMELTMELGGFAKIDNLARVEDEKSVSMSICSIPLLQRSYY